MNLKGTTNGSGRLSVNLKIALFAIVILLVGFLLYRQVDRMAGTRRTVWVAASDLARDSVLGPESFESKRIREGRVPAGAITDRSSIEGRRLARVKAAGAPFVAGDFAAAGGGAGAGITGYVPEGRVLMTVGVNARSVPYPQLRRGDHLNLVAATRGGDASGSVANDAYFIGWIESQQASQDSGKVFGIDLRPPGAPAKPGAGSISLLLALNPQDVLSVARAQAAGIPISVVLHGLTEVQEGKLLDLSAPRAAQIELIAGGNRQTVALEP